MADARTFFGAATLAPFLLLLMHALPDGLVVVVHLATAKVAFAGSIEPPTRDLPPQGTLSCAKVETQNPPIHGVCMHSFRHESTTDKSAEPFAR